jgi:predicted ferric reductase
MLTTSKTRQNFTAVFITLAVTLLVWLGSKWFYHDWFDNPFKYPAKAASLTATVLMCWCIVLSTRLRIIEIYFGGLDKVYQVHKRLGKGAFYIILAHPLFLAMNKLPDVKAFLQSLWFQNPAGDQYLIGLNIGIIALLFMALLIAVTLWISLPYHRWKRTHEWFGLALLIILVHIIVIDRDIARYPLLGFLMYSQLCLALAAFLYIRFLYRFLGPRYHYRVSNIERQGDILEITFSPEQNPMDFRPSQFVYLVVHKEGITPEPHPYSIACGYNLDSHFKLGIKKIGDHTRTLDLLETGDPVSVYGPYGHFCDKFLSGERDCVFIGGGIGITPFLGMWHVALHSEERISPTEAPEALERLHPEIMKSWKSPRVSLFYVCARENQATFDNDIRSEVILSHFHGFEAFENRGHHYELYLDSLQGFISAEYIDRKVRGGVRDKNIFLCGPSPMVSTLIRQFTALGVPARQIITEDFNLL